MLLPTKMRVMMNGDANSAEYSLFFLSFSPFSSRAVMMIECSVDFCRGVSNVWSNPAPALNAEREARELVERRPAGSVRGMVHEPPIIRDM